MVSSVQFVKAQHISRLHHQSVSGVLLLLSSQPELSLWGEPTKPLHCDGKYVLGILKSWRRTGFTKGSVQDTLRVVLLLTWSIPDLDRHSSFSDLELSKCSSLFWIPAGSSTPDLYRCRANHQEGLLPVTGQLDYSEQYTHKSLYRQGICASWKKGDTGHRICAVNPRKVQRQEELVSQLPMNTQITEPLWERDTPPPLTCECLLWHRELLMEMRCQVGKISFFYEKVSGIYEICVKVGLDDGVNYIEKASFTKNRCMFLKGTKYTLQEKKRKHLVKIVRNLSVPLKHPGVKPSFLKATSTPPEMWKKTTKNEKLIDHITILPHYHSSYQQSSSKDWLSPGAKQATSYPFLSKTWAKSSSAPRQAKLSPFCKCQDVIHCTQPHRP